MISIIHNAKLIDWNMQFLIKKLYNNIILYNINQYMSSINLIN